MRKLKLKELGRKDAAAFKAMDKHAVLLILDNIRSALNVGSAFRTADALALSGVYLCGITAKPPHREILKTAIGATDSVDWTHFPDTVSAIREAKRAGYTVLGAEQTDESVMLHQFQPDKANKYAIVMGNEVKGVSNEALPLLDGCLEIPQFGTKHSFNVSVATGIIAWDVVGKMYLGDGLNR